MFRVLNNISFVFGSKSLAPNEFVVRDFVFANCDMIRKLRRIIFRALRALFILSVGYFAVTLINVASRVPSSWQDVDVLTKSKSDVVYAIQRESMLPLLAQETQRRLRVRTPGTIQRHLNKRSSVIISENSRGEDPHEFSRKGSIVLEQTSEKSQAGQDENLVNFEKFTREPEPVQRSHKCVAKNDHIFPLCKVRFEEFKTTWNEKCHQKKFGVNTSDACSILVYLSEVERWCPPLPWRRKSTVGEERPRTGNAELRRNISGLIELFDRGHFAWLRERSKVMWPEWMDALDSLSRKRNFLGRRKKSILVYMGSFVVNPYFFEQAFTGGPQGELVQWSDVIATLYILGHDLVIAADESEITRKTDPVVTHPEDGCAATNLSKFYDLIFTDIPGTTTIRYHTGPNFSRYKCKLRILDTFGTEAEFNYKYYKEKLNGGRSIWADLNVNLQQFMTMYPHTPDNMFMGFSVPHKSTRDERNHTDKKIRGLVYGKRPSYFNEKKHYLDIFHKFMEIHGNIGEDVLDSNVPNYVINHGIVNGSVLTNLLKQSKIFIGLGFPYEGPAPLDAIANGCFYVNPKLKTPLNRENVYFFQDKPTFRKIYSQNPYAQDFIGKPFVHTIDMENDTEVENAIQEILRSKETPYLPYEFTHEGMLERVNAFVDNLEFCTEHQWPPLQELVTVVSGTGNSCKDTCFGKGLLCEPSFFRHLNTADMLGSASMECKSLVVSESLVAPSLNKTDSTCLLQDQPLLFSCVASREHVIRLCPCRRFRKDQVALCPSC